MEKLVDITGLGIYHEKLKTVVLSKMQADAEADATAKADAAQAAAEATAAADATTKADAAQAAAEATAAADATAKADAAQAAAETYADGLVKDEDGKVKFDAAGAAAAAQAAAEATAAADATAKADAAQAAAEATAAADATSKANAAQAAAEATAAADATSKANAAQAAAEATAAADATAKADAAKAAAEQTATNLNTAMNERVVKLEAINHEQLALDASAAAVAAIVAGAESDFDTLKEVADWIASDTTNSAVLQATVSGHTDSINTINGDIDALEANKQDNITDLVDIRSGAAAGATALQENDLVYVTDTDIEGLFSNSENE